MWEINPIFKKGITTNDDDFDVNCREWSHIITNQRDKPIFCFGDYRPFNQIPLPTVIFHCPETVTLTAFQTVRFAKELLRLVGKKAVIEDA